MSKADLYITPPYFLGRSLCTMCSTRTRVYTAMLGTSQHALRGTMALSLRRYHPIFFPLFNQKALLSSLYPYTTADIVSLNQDFHLSSRTQNSVAASVSFSGKTNEFIVSFMPLQYKCNAIHYSSWHISFPAVKLGWIWWLGLICNGRNNLL